MPSEGRNAPSATCTPAAQRAPTRTDDEPVASTTSEATTSPPPASSRTRTSPSRRTPNTLSCTRAARSGHRCAASTPLSNRAYARCRRCSRAPTNLTTGHTVARHARSPAASGRTSRSSTHVPYVAAQRSDPGGATTTARSDAPAHADASASAAGPPPTMATSCTGAPDAVNVLGRTRWRPCAGTARQRQGSHGVDHVTGRRCRR